MNTQYIVPLPFINTSSICITLTVTESDHLVINHIKLDLDETHSSVYLPEKIQIIAQSFKAYFSRECSEIDVPYQLVPKSEYQSKVLAALKAIPYGETLTYGALAKKIDSHPRAIGQALKCNPLPLIYPCHRVVSQKGLGGFMGTNSGRLCDIKHLLLQLENKRNGSK